MLGVALLSIAFQPSLHSTQCLTRPLSSRLKVNSRDDMAKKKKKKGSIIKFGEVWVKHKQCSLQDFSGPLLS